jgi:hypothetical protein
MAGASRPQLSAVAWLSRSLPIDPLSEGAKYYRYDPQEAKRSLAEVGSP